MKRFTVFSTAALAAFLFTPMAAFAAERTQITAGDPVMTAVAKYIGADNFHGFFQNYIAGTRPVVYFLEKDAMRARGYGDQIAVHGVTKKDHRYVVFIQHGAVAPELEAYAIVHELFRPVDEPDKVYDVERSRLEAKKFFRVVYGTDAVDQAIAFARDKSNGGELSLTNVILTNNILVGKNTYPAGLQQRMVATVVAALAGGTSGVETQTASVFGPARGKLKV